MKNKKAICFIMALLMLAMAPLALDNVKENTTTKIEAGCIIPDIIVVSVPGNADVLINPLQIPVEINNENVTDQIITEPVSIHNMSAAPVNVTVNLVGQVKSGSEMSIVGLSTKSSTSTRKRAFVYFEIQATSDPDQVNWDSEYDAEKHLILRTSNKIRKNMVRLDAGDENAPSGNKCYGAFRLTGDCTVNPKTPWTEADGINATVVFSFTLTS